MYNRHIKREYLSKVNESQLQFEIMLFNKLDKFEKENGCDIAQIDLDDIMRILCKLYKQKEFKYRALLSIINYKTWYFSNTNSGVGSQLFSDEYYELISDINDIRFRMVSSPYFMGKYLNSIFDPIEFNTIDNIYRCAIWLIYIGVDEKELVNISIDDVDLFHRVITVNGQDRKILDEAFDSIKNCVESTSYYVNLGGRRVAKELMDRRGGRQLLRSYRENSPSEAAFLETLKKAHYRKSVKSTTSKRMTFSSIRDSGLFYSIRKAEIEEGDYSKLPLLYNSASRKHEREYEYFLWCLAGAF